MSALLSFQLYNVLYYVRELVSGLYSKAILTQNPYHRLYLSVSCEQFNQRVIFPSLCPLFNSFRGLRRQNSSTIHKEKMERMKKKCEKLENLISFFHISLFILLSLEIVL